MIPQRLRLQICILLPFRRCIYRFTIFLFFRSRFFVEYEKVFLYHNLQLSLLLQPQFQLDAIDKALMLQKPHRITTTISCFKWNRGSRKDLVLSQYTMLDCYQSEFRDIETLLQNGLLRENDLLQLEDQRNFADEQLTRNFLWSLMNSTTSRQLTIKIKHT